MAYKSSKTRSFLAAVAALTALSPSVQAQIRCANPSAFDKLPDAAVAQFKANPQGMLVSYPSAGLPLSTEARSLLLSDPNLIDALLEVAKSGNDAQKAAIGAGLAQATKILVCSNPQLAAAIQQKVAQSGLGPLITAYIAASNGFETAALGGQGGGTGPTGGVGQSGGSNSAANPGATPFGVNSSQTGQAVAFVLGRGGGLTVTQTFSVSPTR